MSDPFSALQTCPYCRAALTPSKFGTLWCKPCKKVFGKQESLIRVARLERTKSLARPKRSGKRW